MVYGLEAFESQNDDLCWPNVGAALERKDPETVKMQVVTVRPLFKPISANVMKKKKIL